MDVLMPSRLHQNMKRIRSTDTQAEIMIRKELWHYGLRYRKNWRGLPGTSNIVLVRQKIAIFIDGDFWHVRGHQNYPRAQIASPQACWQKKLSRNVGRDKEANDALTEAGWLVLRFWESDIRGTLEDCLAEIECYL